MAQEILNYIEVPTEYIEVEGIRYAFRSLGKQSSVPLVCLQHFTGTLDNWDPIIVNGPWNPINAGNIKFVEKLDKIARRLKASSQQVALSWLYHHEPNILLIPGTSKVKHVEENVKAAGILLSAEEMHEHLKRCVTSMKNS